MTDASKDISASLNIRAGMLAAAGWGAFGAVGAAVTVAALESDQSYFEAALWPILGCGIVLACTGWAARAPRPSHRIGASLLIVTAGSIVMWALIAAAEITPRRYKDAEHPIMYPSEAIALLTPPILMAAILTTLWCTKKAGLTGRST